MAEEICERLRFSNDETEQILALVDNHMRFGHVHRMKESTLKKFLRIPNFAEHLLPTGFAGPAIVCLVPTISCAKAGIDCRRPRG